MKNKRNLVRTRYGVFQDFRGVASPYLNLSLSHKITSQRWNDQRKKRNTSKCFSIRGVMVVRTAIFVPILSQHQGNPTGRHVSIHPLFHQTESRPDGKTIRGIITLRSCSTWIKPIFKTCPATGRGCFFRLVSRLLLRNISTGIVLATKSTEIRSRPWPLAISTRHQLNNTLVTFPWFSLSLSFSLQYLLFVTPFVTTRCMPNEKGQKPGG